jgi:hypothetical protein
MFVSAADISRINDTITIPLTATETGFLMTNAIAEMLSRPTITVEEFMQITRSGRSSTYAAIAAGEIETFRVGRVHKIGTAWLKAKLGIVAA